MPERNRSRRRPQPKPAIRIFPVIRGFLLFLLFFMMGAAALVSVMMVVFLRDAMQDLPQVEDMRTPSLTSVLYDRHDRVIAKLFDENRSWAELSQISPWAIRAVIAAEDGEFYAHRGIRVLAIVRAALGHLTQGAAAQGGGSTITQQVARLMLLDNEFSLRRKAREAILAIQMERTYTKDQILELYLNMAFFGQRAYGIKAAAQNYFGKDVTNLSLAEASMLAGLLPAPSVYNPLRNPDRAKTRQNYVLTRMVDDRMITDQDKTLALAANLQYTVESAEARVRFVMEDAPHFVSHVLFGELLPKYGRDQIYRGGLTVRTTIDLELQKHAEEVISNMQFEGALVCLDPNTGEILALVGGRNFDDSAFNRATQAFRQPGSAFKPILYAAALENGFRPMDRMFDAPITFSNGWSPRNSDGTFRGEMTLVDALSLSINTIAVRLGQLTGVREVRSLARRMGITTPHLPDDLSVVLGSSSLTPLEMGAAFCAFANDGYRVEPYGVREVLNSRGDALEQNGPVLSRAMSPETAATVRSMLMQSVSWGTGTRANLANVGYQTFGKTGTTNEWTDVWFVGGTPGLVTVVYVGNDNHTSLGRAFGGTVAAPAWREFMEGAVKIMNTPDRFNIPPGVGVENLTMCRSTGFRATQSCPVANIVIASGQAPDAYCPLHGGDFFFAQADINAPVLLLTPEDDALRSQYQLAGLRPEETLYDDFTVYEPTPVVQPQPLPEISELETYVDHSRADEIEERYQELLRQYNLM